MKKIVLLLFVLFTSTGLIAGVIATQPIGQVTAGNTQVSILGKTLFPQAIAFVDTGQKTILVADSSVMKKSTGSSSKALLIKASDVARVENSASGTASTLVLKNHFDSKQTI